MTPRRRVSIQPSSRSARRARITASREEPVQPASSSWVIASSMCDAVAVGLAEAIGQLDEPRADAADRVLGQVLGALAVGVAQAAGDHPREHERHAGRALEEAR